MNRFRAIARSVTPPFAAPVARRLQQVVVRSGRLFDGDDKAFAALARRATNYGEYGCGASTAWVLNNTKATVLSVDTSAPWVAKVIREAAEAGAADRCAVRLVDLGPVGEWGRPESYERRERFPEYTNWIWDQGADLDLVLIDGRFRVASFLTSLLRAKPGTSIVFDDYRDRKYYHVVQELIDVQDWCGRQAVFVAPDPASLDRGSIVGLLDRYRYVMD